MRDGLIQSLETLNVFNNLTLKKIIWKTNSLTKELDDRFLVQSTKVENAAFPYETDLSKLNFPRWGVQNGPITKNKVLPDDENNFPHKLLLTNKQVANLRLSSDIKLSKTQLSKMIQSGGFFGRLLGPLLKTGLPLIKNVIKPLAKSVLIPLGFTAAASAADSGIHKKY